MNYPRQSSTLARLSDETRKSGRAQEDAAIATLRRQWDTTKANLQAIIMMLYRIGHGSEPWTLAAAGPTLERMGHSCTNELINFHNAALALISKASKEAYRHEALRQVWIIDQLTPPSRKPKMPERALRESAAPRPGAGSVTWQTALGEWLRAYAANLATNLRLEALHSGSITDAADEVDAAKIDGFEPGYKFSSAITDQILLAQREARHDAAEENDDLVAEEVFRTMESSTVCEDCEGEDGKKLEDVDVHGHVYGFRCRCFEEIVPRSFAELLRNGTEDEKEAALDAEARGLVPDAMAIKDPDSGIIPSEQTLKAHAVVSFNKWLCQEGLSISGRGGN
jgi:hypothetical protein